MLTSCWTLWCPAETAGAIAGRQTHQGPGATALGARALMGLAVFSPGIFVILMSHLMPWWLLLSTLAMVMGSMLLLVVLLDR